MTSGILESDLPTGQSTDPQFDHSVQPWLMVGMAAALALLLLTFFVYGQMAPGA